MEKGGSWHGLEAYINHPLETSQSANHDDTDGETVPESSESNFPVDPAHDGSKCLARFSIRIQFTDHDIGGVGDNGTENTSEISTGEGDTGLRSLAIVALLSGETVINLFNNSLKRSKLHHGIGNLTSPQWIQSLVKAGPAFFGYNGVDAVQGASIRVGYGALHAYLDSFKRTKSNVGEELGRRRSGQVKPSFVLVRSFWASNVAVRLLEIFIPAVLEGSLCTIPKKCRAPAGHDAANPLGAVNLTPGLEVAGVEFRVDLTTGFYEIKGRYSRVCETLFNQALP